MEPVQMAPLPAMQEPASATDSTLPQLGYQPHTMHSLQFSAPPPLAAAGQSPQRQTTEPPVQQSIDHAPSAQPPAEQPPSPSPPPARHSSPHASTPRYPSANGQAEEEVGVAAGGRRHVGIKPKGWAGSAVWAKLAQYPWWPAQVLDEKDPYIPAGAEPPRRGAVPVRFFGTYEFSYIQSQRALAPFDATDDRSTKCDDVEFKLGVREAEDFMATGSMPTGFFQQHEPTPPPPPKARRISKAKSKKLPRGESAAQAKARELDELAPPPTAHRKERMLRSLALKPPPGSPFADMLCLAGIEGLLAQQNSGQNAVAAAAGPAPVPSASSLGIAAHMPPTNSPHVHPPAMGGAMPGGVHVHQRLAIPASLPQQSVPGPGAGAAMQGGMPGLGQLLHFPSMPLHAPHVNLMPSQPDRSRMQFGALPMQ